MISVTVISTGYELLDGRVANTNLNRISLALAAMGVSVKRCVVVGDDLKELVLTIRESLVKADLLIITGGLGPTEDDCSRDAIAQALHVRLVRDEAVLNEISSFFRDNGSEMTANNNKQADFPMGSVILSNDRGTAPGFCVQKDNQWICAFPGVPDELDTMLETHLSTFISEKFVLPTVNFESNWYCFGKGESAIAQLLSDTITLPNGCEWRFRVHYPEIHVRLFADSSTLSRSDFDDIVKKTDPLLSSFTFSKENHSLVESVASLFLKQKRLLSVAESCTGGLFSSTVVQCPGASQWFKGGVVTYDNAMKQQFLEVDSLLLKRMGAVSEEVAGQMAVSIRKKCLSDIGVSITGIAGPDGGTKEKPVGLVCFAIADKDTVNTWTHQFYGDRHRIQKKSVAYLLWYLFTYLNP